MTTIAFVGLGAMGMPMARNLLARGYTVRGFDIDARSTRELARDGGASAASAAEAATGARILILMVVDASQAEQILFDAGALAALAEHGTVCLMATCPPGAVERIAQRVVANGRHFVDAPVSGGVSGAMAASLTIMAACETPTFEMIRPVLEAMGDRLFHVGERPGQGAMVKAINQLLCGVHIAAMAEALSLAAKAEIDRTVVLEILSGSAASSWMLKDRGSRMLERNPPVRSAIDIFVKDLGIVMEAGRDSRAALPIAAIAQQLFLAASGRGEGRSDDSQVIRSYYLMNGVDPN